MRKEKSVIWWFIPAVCQAGQSVSPADRLRSSFIQPNLVSMSTDKACTLTADGSLGCMSVHIQKKLWASKDIRLKHFYNISEGSLCEIIRLLSTDAMTKKKKNQNDMKTTKPLACMSLLLKFQMTVLKHRTHEPQTSRLFVWAEQKSKQMNPF